MTLTPLTIPAGVFRNGTDLQSSGRWRDVSLVRWSDGVMQPVGGWSLRATLTSDPIRGAHTWQDLTGDRWIATGSASGLFVAPASGTPIEITPSGYSAGTVDAEANTGFGGGLYGTAYYGVPRPEGGTIGEATSWSLDNWGEYLVACSNDDGKIYEWQLNTSTDAQVVANAPVDNLGILVTEERFLFALGAGGNPRKVQFSDREDNTSWTPTATNEAGDIELQTSGQIMLGLRVRSQSLILTDTDAHTASYQGPPFVYGFERVGSSCGVISRHAAAAADVGAFWMGRESFFMFRGNTVEPLPCEVADYVFNDINADQRSKVSCVNNGRHSEIWWFYPSADSIECNKYVAYNYRENHWLIGDLSRTSGVDAGVFTKPIWFTSDGKAYNHEAAFNHDGDPIFAETGPISIGSGDNVMNVTQMIPDEKTQGQVTATFKTRFYPNDVEREYGPYTMSAPTSVRFTGRQVRMRVNGTDLSDWRFGVARIDVKPRGKR